MHYWILFLLIIILWLSTFLIILKNKLNKQEKLLIEILKDDEQQRKNVLHIKDKFDKQFTLLENLTNFYNQMLEKMISLDEMGGYETNDDFGVFFKYIKQSLYDIQIFFENTVDEK